MIFQKKTSFNISTVFLIAIVIISAACIKLNQIRVKNYLSPDEVLYCSLAIKMAVNLSDYSPLFYYEATKQGHPEKTLPAYFNKPLFKHPPMYCLLLVIPQRFGFQGLKNINYFSFYIALLLPLIVFFIAKKLYDDRVAFSSFLFLLITPVYWLCSSRIWMESSLTLFMYLSLFFFILGWERNRYYILSGVFLGFAMLTKYPGALIAPILFIFAAMYKPELFRNKKFYLIFLIAFLIFLPWIIWNIRVYGSFWANLNLHGGWLSMRKLFLEPGSVILLLLFVVFAGLIAFKGYIARMVKKMQSKTFLNSVIGGVFLLFIFSLPNVHQGLAESFFLNKLPPVSNYFPNIFAKEPWFFYFGQLLKMSPLFILSYFGIFFFNSKSKGDKLLLISVFVILLFYIKWGNYQSRYILPA
ncbi:MAG: hypothetical protein B5M48_03590, partial [Candidatus Omnitrophica bacterium 4484_213]